MNYGYYKKYVNKKDTIGKYDTTPLFSNSEVFSNLVKDLSFHFIDKKIDKVVGLDASGFIIGGAIASFLKVGFVPVRREGKLPLKKKDLLRSKVIDYSGKEFIF